LAKALSRKKAEAKINTTDNAQKLTRMPSIEMVYIISIIKFCSLNFYF
jgi:hypothetical protein